METEGRVTGKCLRKCVENASSFKIGISEALQGKGVASAIGGRRLFVTPAEHCCLLYIYVHAGGTRFSSKRHSNKIIIFYWVAGTWATASQDPKNLREEEMSRGSCDGGRLTTLEHKAHALRGGLM